MTSEEGDENPSSTGAVLNGNPPMTHVPKDVLKDFITHTPARPNSPITCPNSNLINTDKKMQLVECASSSIENPVKKMRIDSSIETSTSVANGNTKSVLVLPTSPEVANNKSENGNTKSISALPTSPEVADNKFDNGNTKPVSTLPTSPEIADKKLKNENTKPVSALPTSIEKADKKLKNENTKPVSALSMSPEIADENTKPVSALPMSPEIADKKLENENAKSVSALPTPPEIATFEKVNGNSTISTPTENGNKTPAASYSNTLLLAMYSSSISLTPKLQTKKSILLVENPKENPDSEDRLLFPSSVSLTMKVPSSSNETSTLTEKTFSLPKSPKNVIPPPESLSDLEKKIVGSVSISPKSVDKQLNDSFKSVDEMENIDELLNPGSPFSDTSSHISLSLEEDLLRDEHDLENEKNQSISNKEKSVKTDNDKVEKERHEHEKSKDKQEELVKGTNAKSPSHEETNLVQNKDQASDDQNNLMAHSDKDDENVEDTTQEKCDIKDDAKDNEIDEKQKKSKVSDCLNKTKKGNDLNENNKVASLDLVKDIEKIELECKNKNKFDLTKENSYSKMNESNKVNEETQLKDVKSSLNTTREHSIRDIADDIFEADEGSVEDGNETNFAIFDEKDDYNDDSDEETIKPAINLLIGSLAKDIRGEGSDGSCSSKNSSIDQDEESSAKTSQVIDVNEAECKSNSSSKEVSSSLQMDVDESSQSSAATSNFRQIKDVAYNKSNQEQCTTTQQSISSADKSVKETLQSSNTLRETDVIKKVNTKASSSLTFSEALKSIEADSAGDVFPSLKDRLEPLKPSAEFISSEVLPSEKTLTLLQPSSKRPIDDISTSEQSGTSSLKRMRFFKDDKDPLVKQGSDAGKNDQSRVLLGMEKCLRKEKANFGASDKNSMNDVDPEVLLRRTAQELEKVKPPKSLPKLQRIKRKELESLVVELFMDKVLYEHELGQQRDLCKRLEATLESNRKKAAQFHKEVEDLKKVTQRLQAEHLARKGQVVAPVKVKRSVGIQATPSIIGKGLMHASCASNAIRLISPSKSVSRPTTPPKSTLTETNRSATPTGNKNSKPAASIRQKTTTSVQTNNVAIGAGGKVRQIQTTRVVVSQPVSAPSSQVNANTNAMVVVNSSQQMNSPQQIITTQGPVSALIPTTMNTHFVRAGTAQIPAVSPMTQGILSSSPLPVTNIVRRVTVANSGGTGLIDLTDDDDPKGVAPQQARIATSAVIVPRSIAGTTSQFVTIPHQSQMGQLLLVPSSTGSPTTALVVGNMPGTTPTAIMSGSPNTILRPNILAANSQRLGPGTRVVVGTPMSQMNGGTLLQAISRPKHPAPLPEAPLQEMGLVGYSKKLPPVPILKLSHKDNSIVLSWNMNKTDEHDVISSYQLFAYQEGTAPPSPLLWKKVGSVKALELPMACTLTQFMPGHVYHFAVRAVDAKCRSGPFSEPKSIRLQKQVVAMQ